MKKSFWACEDRDRCNHRTKKEQRCYAWYDRTYEHFVEEIGFPPDRVFVVCKSRDFVDKKRVIKRTY